MRSDARTAAPDGRVRKSFRPLLPQPIADARRNLHFFTRVSFLFASYKSFQAQTRVRAWIPRADQAARDLERDPLVHRLHHLARAAACGQQQQRSHAAADGTFHERSFGGVFASALAGGGGGPSPNILRASFRTFASISA